MCDVDIEETVQPTEMEAVRDDAVDRRKFLKMAGSAAVVGALGFTLAACGDDSDSSGTTTSSDDEMKDKSSDDDKDDEAKKDGSGDLAIVNYALTLEHIEADFYAAVLDSGIFTNTRFAKYADTLKAFGEHEAEHVTALMQVAQSLGEPAPKPKTDFSDVLAKGPDAVAGLAANVENLGAAAYLEQAAKIKSPDILAAALAIHTVEARHAAALNFVVGYGIDGKAAAKKAGSPPPAYFGILPTGAFAEGSPMEEVLKLAQPFIVA